MMSQPVAPLPASITSAPSEARLPAEELVRLCLIATYFGPLPPYFQLWLRSCSTNPEVQFLVVTDQSPDAYRLPANVHFERVSLAEVRDIFSAGLGFPVALRKAYKICDLRPFFWMLVDWFGIGCSHWGHCDLDVIFGDLEGLIPAALLRRHDRLFELGHLTIYRHSALANSMAFSPRMGTDWTRVVSSDAHFGFDEHRGVNLAWETSSLRWHRDLRICFDVEPRATAIQTSQFGINHRRQAIYWVEGHLFHAFLTLAGRVRVREIAYLHFQKRRLVPQLNQENVRAFALTPDSFVELPLGADGAVDVQRLLAGVRPPSLKDSATVALNSLRYLRARMQLRRQAAAAR